MTSKFALMLKDPWISVAGEKFEELYTRYEKEGRAKRTVKAQALWYAIIESQVGSYYKTEAILWL